MVGHLDHRYAAEVRDIMTNPPSVDKYKAIKDALISRLSASAEKRVKLLLTQEEMGDRTPSQFLRHLRSLAEDSQVPDTLLRSIWIARLPGSIQVALATQPPETALDVIARLADSVHEVAMPQRIAAASMPFEAIQRLEARFDEQQTAQRQQAQVLTDLARSIEALTRAIPQALQQDRSRSRDNSRYRRPTPGRQRDADRSQTRSEENVCWYHRRFGDAATRCTQPCSMTLGNQNTNSENSGSRS